MKVTVRVAGYADMPVVTRLLAEMDAAPGEVEPMPLARAERILREMSRYPDYRCYLAFDGDAAIGTFTLLVFEALVHGGTREALLDGVVVSAARRGKGLGRQMLGHAMRIARESGCYKLALSSNLKRADAHRFYQSLGFTQHGVSFAIEPGVGDSA